jgi:hypothetical protein
MNAMSRTGMTRARWEYLKALRPSEPRYLHVSVPISFKTDHLGNVVPFAAFPHSTFSAGRNKAKRERRAAARALRQRSRP